MAELPGRMTVRRSRMAGAGAWATASAAIGPPGESRHIDAQAPVTPPGHPGNPRAVEVTQFSAGNRWRFPIIEALWEWARFRPNRGGHGRPGDPRLEQFFLAQPIDPSRQHRAMQPPRVLAQLIPSRSYTYEAEMYGGSPATDPATLSAAAARRNRHRGRRQIGGS